MTEDYRQVNAPQSRPLIAGLAGRLEWQPAEIAAYRRKDGLHITFTLWEERGLYMMMNNRTGQITSYESRAAALTAAAATEIAAERPAPRIAESDLAQMQK